MKLYNSWGHKTEEFVPIDESNVRLYVCGPTVYDRPHIGNARPAVVFDVLYRLLKHKYKQVTYVRNITDIDDKIYQASVNKKITIEKLTTETVQMYHSDISALNVLPVDIEPYATMHIAEIISFISKIISNGYGYESNNHIYFDTVKFQKYGQLSNINECIDGSRVDISENKRNPADFVLWKPISAEFPVGWDSPWGKGRPGWHIECSAMSCKYLGVKFDIHGGGHDLIFPHHENEIAQSYAANNELMSNYWVHNGHVMVNGTKMSKSLGNFYTVSELLNEFPGEVIRLALLMTHYRSPINFTKQLLLDAKNILDRWYITIRNAEHETYGQSELDDIVVDSLSNDLNTPMAITRMSALVSQINKGDTEIIPVFVKTARDILGVLLTEPQKWFQQKFGLGIDAKYIEDEIARRNVAKQNKDYVLADTIRKNLLEYGVVLEDTVSGTQWKHL